VPPFHLVLKYQSFAQRRSNFHQMTLARAAGRSFYAKACCCSPESIRGCLSGIILGSARGSRAGFGGSPKRTLLKIDIVFLSRTILPNGRDHSAWISNRMVHRRSGPRHVHVYDSKERLLGRLDLQSMRGIEGWMPSRKLIKVIEELKKEGRL
jgi:FAD/FMN-containing dehydrogenase